MTRFVLIRLFGLLLCTTSIDAFALQRPWVFEATALTGYYKYDATEVRRILPEAFQAGLDVNDLSDQDDDVINYSLGIGYRLSEELLIKVTFVDGLDLDPIFQDFCIFACNNDDLRFNLDMQLIEIDAEYTAYRFSEKINLFVAAGVSHARLDGDIRRFDRDNSEFNTVTSISSSKTGAKGTIGINWQISRLFSLTVGHQRHSNFKMNKTYLSMGFHF